MGIGKPVCESDVGYHARDDGGCDLVLESALKAHVEAVRLVQVFRMLGTEDTRMSVEIDETRMSVAVSKVTGGD